ncbi:LysR family transcriptional regulator [Streptomyces sp. NBC_00370]|uniref:LysR family transcriptional regulator n=1 Tax=Streptomyces sp. NBC_00370 TaxID=2975728 RepID=UPI002E263C2B
MELRHLEYFLAVADTASFTRAASRLNVVQSGVSATVKSLERELGSALFVRSPQEITLTAAGRAFLPRARETLDAARAAKDAVHRTQGALHGTVTVGTLTSIDLVDLPGLLAELHERHPGVTVRLRAAVAGSLGLVDHLRDGRLDVAFLSLPGPSPAGLDTRPLAVAPLLLYVPRVHPLAGAGQVSLAQLAEFPFVDSPPGFGNRIVVDRAFASAGVEREVTLEVADIGTAVTFIRAGLGIGFLSRFLIHDLTGLDVLRVADHELTWQLGVATAANRRPGATTEALLDLLRERHPALRQLGGPDDDRS